MAGVKFSDDVIGRGKDFIEEFSKIADRRRIR